MWLSIIYLYLDTWNINPSEDILTALAMEAGVFENVSNENDNVYIFV